VVVRIWLSFLDFTLWWVNANLMPMKCWFLKSFLSVVLIVLCALSLFFSNSYITECCTAHHGQGGSRDFHHDIEHSFSQKAHIDTHYDVASGTEHTHSHAHRMLCVMGFLGAIFLSEIILITRIFVSRIRTFSFLIPVRLHLFLLFRPPKFSFSI